MRNLIIVLLGLLASSVALGQHRSMKDSDRTLRNEPISTSLRTKFSDPMGYSYYPTIPSGRTCFTDEHMNALTKKAPSLYEVSAFEKALAIAIAKQEHGGIYHRQEQVLKIPVVVHVIHNGESVGSGPNISQAQINSQIQVLNDDFRRLGAGTNTHPQGADIEIVFELALYDPNGVQLPEPGINRVDGGRSSWSYGQLEASLKGSTQWNPEKYFNIWTVNFGGESADLLGYAQFPSLSELDGLDRSGGAAETDGVVCRYTAFGNTGNVQAPYNEGRTMTHEVGHWLGLRHIWGDGDCFVDDYCDDTPTASAPNYECVPNNSCDDGASDAGDMIENYMDYTPDACMNVFTLDQKARIRAVLAISPRRKELTTNADDVIEETEAPIVAANASSFSVCKGDSFTLTDVSTNTPTSRSWSITNFRDDTIATSTAEEFVFLTSNAPLGDLNVNLIVANGSGSDTLMARRALHVYSNEGEVAFAEDMEKEIELVNWAIRNLDDDRTWTYSVGEELSSAYGLGEWSLMFDNYSADDDPTGTEDGMVSPPLDLSNAVTPNLTFDYAYARFSEEYSDTLAVYYSLDCGNSWNQLWSLGGADLETAAMTSDPFYPTAEQWGSAQISLQEFAGESQLHLAFVNRSGWGNLLYIDNMTAGEAEASAAAIAGFTALQTTICAGDLVNFQDQSDNLPSSWQWTFEGGTPSSSSDQNPSIGYETSGIYDVSLTATNSIGGNSASLTDYIEVVDLPQLTISGENTPCQGETITLTATGGENIKWFSRGSIINEGETFTLVAGGNSLTFEITGENALGCEGSTQFTINPLPATSTISQSDDGTLTASNGVSYQWYADGVIVPGATGQSIFPTASTTYTVEVTNANGCVLLSQPFHIGLDVTGISSDLNESFKIFPNPTQGAIQISLKNENIQPVTITIHTMLGTQMVQEAFQKHGEELHVSLTANRLTPGLYWVSINQAGSPPLSSRLVVQ